MVRHFLRPFALCTLLVLAVSARGEAPRLVKTIDRDWTFQYLPDPAGAADPAAPAYDDRRWPAIALPHTWSTYETTGDVHPFIENASERDDTYWWYGWGWYRKHLVLGSELSGRRVSLVFDGVQKYAKVYFNGAFVAEHKGGYTGFCVDVTDRVRFGGDNVLAVQVSNRRDDPFGGIPPMTAGNFDVYGGIYRDVRLVVTDPVHIPYQGSAAREGGTFVTTPQVSEQAATVVVRTWVANDGREPAAARLVSTLVDPDGKTLARVEAAATLAPGDDQAFSQEFPTVSRPQLWSPDTPRLYRVRSEVWREGRLVDTYESPFGIRWFHWDFARNRLILNGHEVLLRGMNRHQEFPWLGDAMPKWMHDRDLEDMRHNLGLNFQRTVHYPNDPHTYDVCDRLGFMLIEEQPNIKDIEFGRDIQKEDLVEAIRRDRNHPSILIWSMGNETNRPADSAWAAAEDPTRIRYMRRAENGGKFIQLTDKNLPIENLLRCTIRGWYDRDDHAFGRPGPNPSSSQVTGTEEWQYRRCVESGRMLHQNVVVWLYSDHGCERNYLGSPLRDINPKGWTDPYRFPKFVYYLWEANFGSKPMVYIHPTYWRPQYLGQARDILVDSNCDTVELTLDGRSLGVQRPTDANVHSLTFRNVPVSRGTLVAVGRRGPEQVTWTQPMAGPAARLVLTASSDRIAADRAGIAVVSLDVVDANGAHVFGAHPPLTWSVSGPAKLVGPSVYVTDTDKHGAHAGTMYIDAPVSNVIRAADEPGLVVVRVSAPGFEPVETRIQAVAPPPDAVPGIGEPRLSDAGRVPVSRDPSFRAVKLAAKGHILAEIPNDVHFTARTLDGYRHQLEAFVLAHNPKVDTFSVEYRAFIERVAQTLQERDGELVADDYNFDVRDFNTRLAQSLGSGPAPSAAKVTPTASAAQLDRWREAIRATFHVPTPLPPLEPRVHRRFHPAPGVAAEAVTYATELGMRVPAILYLPDPLPAGRIPGFVVITGHGGDKYSWYPYYTGILYARAGMAVLTYDQAGEGERNDERKSGTREHDSITGGPPMARRLAGLMITDAMQGVAYLASRPEVDPSRIGAGGYSLGSFVMALTGAVDRRLHAAVEVGGGNLDGIGGYWDRSNKPMCQGFPYQSLAFLGDRPAVLYALHAQRGPTLIWNGREDTVVNMPHTPDAFFEDLQHRVERLRGTAEGVFQFGFTPRDPSPSGPGKRTPASHRPYFLSKPVALWLDRQLHFANWTPEHLAAMPEVKIGDWARAHGVAIERLYDTPEREAGLIALDADVPGYSRQELNVFTAKEWEARKIDFVLSSWVRREQATLTPDEAASVGVPGGKLVRYGPTPDAVASTTFQVTANGMPLFVEHFKDVSYARLAASGSVTLAITAPEAIHRCAISPVSYGITPRVEGRTATFVVDRPRKLIIHVDGWEKLFVFVDPLERNAPRRGQPGVTDVRTFCPSAEGMTPHTPELQRAIDTVAKQGGGILYFPAGRYPTGTLYLRSGVSLYLESGALLQGTDNPDDYRGPEGKAGGPYALVQIDGARDAWIYGRGVIASSGTALRRKSDRHLRLVEFYRARDSGVKDVILRDSAGFNVHIFESENILMKDYKIVNDLRVSNQDGTDPNSSHHVVVDGAFMYTSDDAIAVKADAAPCDDVLVKNGVFWTIKSALKVGSDPRHGASNIVFQDNDVVHADRALAVYLGSDATIRHVVFDHDRSERIGDDAKRQLIIFEMSDKNGLGRGHIEDIQVLDYTAAQFSPRDSTIYGLDDDHCIQNVLFRHLMIEGHVRLSAADARIQERFAKNVRFEP